MAAKGGRPQGRSGPAKGAGPAKGSGPGKASGPRFAGSTKASQPTKLPPRKDEPKVDVHDPDGVRLQKLLAAAGVGSRRVCENLITAGRVEVDGQVVTELGVRIDPVRQTVHVDGVRVQLDESRVYLAFNKPLGRRLDDERRARPGVPGRLRRQPPERLFHVGRLDADTEGLLLLTNDGDLAHRLQHPAYGVPKTYIAQIPAPVPRDLGKRLREGVELDDGPVVGRLVQDRRLASRGGRSSRSSSTRGASTSCAGCSRRSATRCRPWCAPQVGPIQLGDLKSGAPGG